MRYREKSDWSDYWVTPVVNDRYMSAHESILDVNNQKLRPNSKCTHLKGSFDALPVNTVYAEPQRLWTASASSFIEYCDAICGPSYEANYDSCVRKMKRLIDKQVGSFSTLNFLYELRELPDLFKKIRRSPEDLRYIDLAFGILPMLSDLKNAMSAYNSQVEGLNAKLEKYRSIECNWTKVGLVDLDKVRANFGVGNPHLMTTTCRVTTRMRGTIQMQVPVLAGISPEVFKLLDDLQIDISASNAYNAIPWSWFLDWFLPIGDYLDSIPSVMKPLAWFNGTISHTVTGFGSTETLFEGPAWRFPSGQNSGSFKVSIYKRIPFSSSVANMVRWKLSSINSPSQLLILRDIIFSSSNKTIKKLAKKGRAGYKKSQLDLSDRTYKAIKPYTGLPSPKKK